VAGCVFCAIVVQDEELVLRRDGVAAFLDQRPVFHGHVLVVPDTHIETLAELPPGVMTPLFTAVQTVMAALAQALDADGTFVAVNNRVSQSVPHLHVHVVPRHRGDGLRGFFWPRHPYDDDAQRRAVADRIRAAIDAGA
jgi:histidine triad (HIT) family protein